MSDRDWQLEYETQKFRADAAEKERDQAKQECENWKDAYRHAAGDAVRYDNERQKCEERADAAEARAEEAERARDEWERIAMIEDDDELVAAVSERADALEARAERLAEALRELRGATVAAAAEMVRVAISVEDEHGVYFSAARLRDASYAAKKAIDKSGTALAADEDEGAR